MKHIVLIFIVLFHCACGSRNVVVDDKEVEKNGFKIYDIIAENTHHSLCGHWGERVYIKHESGFSFRMTILSCATDEQIEKLHDVSRLFGEYLSGIGYGRFEMVQNAWDGKGLSTYTVLKNADYLLIVDWSFVVLEKNDGHRQPHISCSLVKI
jgi:hypothetical protein